MLVLIKQNRVMAQNHQPILIVDLCVLLDALPIRAELSFHAVMVALNQVLMPIELLHDPNAVFFIFPERITQNIDGIVIRNPFIPVLNQSIVHLCGIWKRAIIKTEHIQMTKMHICNVINHIFCFLCRLSFYYAYYTG